ncbi:Na+/proline symporter [Modicisalibacter ilicicola DSM 19980]|uniref:histidine kinase n=1 Tax=Modicisalibacter ilicicola DSM 19980 TaxID=1121942 RepID=A0A1M5AM25_9GAMM|nr:ATP-binding protein [Halomonas ilicicola]SHF31299.1 Na+/proline symporter [Halomonas ilicicola DSM 19980]
MSVSLGGILALGAGYLAMVFLCALAVERGWVPPRLIRHPGVYSLSLGVYASAWAVYGSVELASRIGYGYLAYYLGVSGAFLLVPVMLVPIQRLARTYQLASLADLFAFRFRSRWVGTLITLITLLAILPLLALQLKTFGDAIHRLTGAGSPIMLALILCLPIALLAIMFGARHSHLPVRHDTLLAAIAVESLVKLAAMLALGGVALYGVFDGPNDLQQWLTGPGLDLQARVARLETGQWRTLLMLFFAAAFLMPHMFHMTFTETPSRRALLQTGWSFPLYLLLMALPVPLILWAAQRLGIDTSASGAAYLAFDISTSPWVDGLAFIAGLAAASGTLIIVALALAGMVLNHLVLVAHPPGNRPNLYRWLLWLRRGLIVAVILGAWLFYRTVGIKHDLADLGLTAFVGIAQCLPGLLAILYWPGANRKGMVCGLVAGSTLWLLGLWLPLVADYSPLVLVPPGLDWLRDEPPWYAVTLIALYANILIFILVSLVTRTSEGERAAAEACSVDAVIRPKRLPLTARTGEDFKPLLAEALGSEVAEREVESALAALNLSSRDGRPYALRRLRDRIQANLSGLMGPSVAQDIVDRFLPYQSRSQATDDIHFVESRLEAYRSRFTGLARELDGLRRHHRRTLARLPIGLCIFDDDGELLMWNEALSRLSAVDGESIIGSHRDDLPAPWAELLARMHDEPHAYLYKQAVALASELRYLTLHKAVLDPEEGDRGAVVILVEDHSELKWLEDELLHSERLASIGRLAAGVAHEIGNPITGISSLVQNLRYDTEDPQVLESAEQIQQLTQRVSRIVGSLVGFAHGGRHVQGTRFVPVELRRLSDEALHLIRLARSGEDIIYDNFCPPGLKVMGDAQRLLQVLINLIGNARDASAPGSRVTLDASAREEWVLLSVTDEGHGIDESIRDRLFEPFTTTKPPGEGTGLGLPLVYSILREHHGDIQISSPPPDQTFGTRITLWLPRTLQDDSNADEPDSDR